MAAISPPSALSALTPSEESFLAEMELVTILPRARLESVPLLAGSTPALTPPHRAQVPLWLALLLKRQHRANVLPPPWLSTRALEQILEYEKSMPGFSPPPPSMGLPSAGAGLSHPFLPSAVADADPSTLPYHWLELAHLLLASAADDVPDPDNVHRLLRDLRETRAAKLRKGVEVLEGAREVALPGVGGLEVVENRAFVCGVVDGLRVIGASKELARREREAEERENGGGGRAGRRGGGADDDGYGGDEDDEDML